MRRDALVRRWNFPRTSHNNLILCHNVSHFHSVIKPLPTDFLPDSSETHNQLHFYVSVVDTVVFGQKLMLLMMSL